ncbi:MAG TPA: Hsp20/alpha crystallin family protein [Candidatus Limnocylindria bacterium]|nr:Hsp20/alpha crystallin family protein [Candidatus Limnocylindria bacterium]
MPPDPIERWQHEVERLFRDLVYNRHPAAHFAEEPWAPPADLMVSGQTARVILELAGVPRASVRVLLRGSRLEISGRRSPPASVPGARYHRAEIYFGDFCRVVELPWDADADSVTALYRDGMLEIQLVAVPVAPRAEIPVKSDEG